LKAQRRLVRTNPQFYKEAQLSYATARKLQLIMNRLLNNNDSVGYLSSDAAARTFIEAGRREQSGGSNGLKRFAHSLRNKSSSLAWVC
jgi:predicted component of type VI protein secretion system